MTERDAALRALDEAISTYDIASEACRLATAELQEAERKWRQASHEKETSGKKLWDAREVYEAVVVNRPARVAIDAEAAEHGPHL